MRDVIYNSFIPLRNISASTLQQFSILYFINKQEIKMKRAYLSIAIMTVVFLILFVVSCDKSENGGSDSQYTLECDIGANDYSIGIGGESGALTTEYNNESTQYG